MSKVVTKEEVVNNSNQPHKGTVVDSRIIELNNRVKDVQSKLSVWYDNYEESPFNVDYSERIKLENELNYLEDSKRELYEFVLNLIK